MDVWPLDLLELPSDLLHPSDQLTVLIRLNDQRRQSQPFGRAVLVQWTHSRQSVIARFINVGYISERRWSPHESRTTHEGLTKEDRESIPPLHRKGPRTRLR
jgi:hypothetical protein